MSISKIIDTHNVYRLYQDRRTPYGGLQLHIESFNTNRLPVKVSQRAKPFGKVKNYSIWYYLPERSSMVSILIIFKDAGYEVIKESPQRNASGMKSFSYIVAKKK